MTLFVAVVELEIPITFALRGETNTMQSRRSSTILTNEVTLAIADASSGLEGPEPLIFSPRVKFFKKFF